MDCSPPGSSIHGILQVRIVEWISMPPSRRFPHSGINPSVSKILGGGHGNPLQDSCLENPMDRGAWWATVHRVAQSRTQLSAHTCMLCACLLSNFATLWTATLWTLAHQAPLSIGFSRQESWSGLPCPPPGDLPHPRTEPASSALQVDSLPQNHWGSPLQLHS